MKRIILVALLAIGQVCAITKEEVAALFFSAVDNVVFSKFHPRS